MPRIEVAQATVGKLDELCEEGESYDELINELIAIYKAEEMTLYHAGEEY
ncbi:DUF7557 family protein [Natronomonas sp. EA1]